MKGTAAVHRLSRVPVLQMQAGQVFPHFHTLPPALPQSQSSEIKVGECNTSTALSPLSIIIELDKY